MGTHLVLAVLTVLFLAATGLSFVRIAHGFVRTLSFPRLQILALTGVLAAFTIWLVDDPRWLWTLLAGQAVVAVVQAACIVQFTPLRRAQSERFAGPSDAPNVVSILSSNVKMSNRDYARTVQAVLDADPDIALLMEVDQAWTDALAPIGEGRPHQVVQPLGNAYGMALYSRHELSDVQVQNLVMDEVPSIIARVTLPDGQSFRIYCVHPEPPVPHIDSAGRDGELLKVAQLVDGDTMPSIVCGDLNDVAWSHTTRLFQRLSGLLDPRIGRGFYSSFDARFWFLRWPLDHLFHDARFRLVAMRRLPYSGSDHFPMYFSLALTDSNGNAELPTEKDAADLEESREIRQEARELDREAIGVDWEK
ncbi:endonuclease/exonuclease/phosphatase family protein [Aurantimonas sp. HBX-1]|uniref:endonuclease/exonuclease/phosphatase family protein n=1 Tax=Aurantimonas sp. HBX-1 TaxID=2906072 RepID=UPI001F31E994|nr:endonuclease/exonuclease/phosphatase family protein [Aurantimonas sp. HBX-1]UIJ74262.1 endonuclease/exonuclease/phosphatase family protein [Aurantimonas sp. HBX-1]